MSQLDLKMINLAHSIAKKKYGQTFPNPSVGGSVSLSWPGMESVADVAVFDLTGRQVAGLTQVVRNEMVNLNLPQGTYVVKMRTETSSATTQLQVVR